MEFRLEERSDGQYEIIQKQPVVLGCFPDKNLARKVMSFLIDDAQAEMNQKPKAPAVVMPPTRSAPVSKQHAGPSPEGKPVSLKPTPPKPLTVEAAAATSCDDEWSEGELSDAFARLARGEKLRSVADHFGKSWTKLRGKWAALKKNYDTDLDTAAPATQNHLPAVRVELQSPIEVVTSAISALKDQTTCTLCGRYFDMTPDNLDTCMRCQNGA